MTEEKRFGNQTVSQIQQENALTQYKREIVDRLNQYLETYPDLFQRWPDTRKDILNVIGDDLSYLCEFKKLTKAMFKDQPPEKVPMQVLGIQELPSEEDNVTSNNDRSKAMERLSN